MNKTNNRSEERRKFLKSSALGAVALLGTSPSYGSNQPEFWSNRNPDWSADGLSGLLFSQVGYEAGQPVRVVVRLPNKEALPPSAQCVLASVADSKKIQQAPCAYWGELWRSHWWVAEFPPTVEAGEWGVSIQNKGNVLMEDSGLSIGKDILWNETIRLASVDMLERRLHFTKVGAGWQDAGTLWVESPAQSAMIIALNELHEQCGESLEPGFMQRLHQQLTVGCDYLVMTQEKAEELGFPQGAMSHDLLGHEKDILPHDASKAVVALLRTVRTLPDNFQKKKDRYQAVAYQAYQWLVAQAQPMGDYGYSRFQRGLPENTPVPADEWPTRDLLTMCQAALEMDHHGRPEAKAEAVALAQQLLNRQITADHPEHGFYGHFKEFDSLPHSEPSWTHGIIATPEGSQFGTVFSEHRSEPCLHRIAEDDGVGDLHHRRLQVQRKHRAVGLGILDRRGEEIGKRAHRHEGRVGHGALVELPPLLEHGRGAVLGDELDPRRSRLCGGDCRRFLVGKEVAP